MKMRSMAVALATALLALPAFADEVSGKWNLSVDTPQGPFAMVFDLKAEGEQTAVAKRASGRRSRKR